MNVLSLFSGVGGLDLGLERAGMSIVGQCESDAAARRVLARHWPDVPCHEDVTGLDAEWLQSHALQPEPEPNGTGRVRGTIQGGHGSRRGNGSGATEGKANRVDLVCGGFPCQDLSVAGNRKGLAGERSGLFFEAARIADLVLGPGGWLVIENVPGLLSSNGGRDFGIVLQTLAQLGFHDLAYRVLDSRYFGVPQRRRRVFIVARRSGGDGAKQVLLEPESGGGDFAPGREAGPGSAATFGEGVAGTVGNGSGKRGWKVSAEDAASGKLVSAKCLTTSQERQDFDTQDFVHPGLRSPGQSLPTSSRVITGDIAPTLQAQTSEGRGGSEGPKALIDDGVRRLTPSECEALQGFPRGWTIPDGTDWREYPKPDGPRYAQMGNAVTVPVAQWLGNRIMSFERDV